MFCLEIDQIFLGKKVNRENSIVELIDWFLLIVMLYLVGVYMGMLLLMLEIVMFIIVVDENFLFDVFIVM